MTIKQLPLKKADIEHGTEQDLVYQPNESRFYPDGLPKQYVFDYYNTFKHGIMEFLRNRKINVWVKSGKDNKLAKVDWVRRDQEISISTDTEYDYWNTGRTVGFYFEIEAEMNIAVINIKPGNQVGMDKTKLLAAEFSEILKQGDGVKSSHLLFDGDDGFMIYVFLDQTEGIDKIRTKVMEWVTHVVKPEPLIVLEALDAPDKIYVNMDGYAVGECFPAPYSLNPNTGIQVTPLNQNTVMTFEPKTVGPENPDWGVKSNLDLRDKINLFFWGKFFKKAMLTNDPQLQEAGEHIFQAWRTMRNWSPKESLEGFKKHFLPAHKILNDKGILEQSDDKLTPYEKHLKEEMFKLKDFWRRATDINKRASLEKSAMVRWTKLEEEAACIAEKSEILQEDIIGNAFQITLTGTKCENGNHIFFIETMAMDESHLGLYKENKNDWTKYGIVDEPSGLSIRELAQREGVFSEYLSVKTTIQKMLKIAGLNLVGFDKPETTHHEMQIIKALKDLVPDLKQFGFEEGIRAVHVDVGRLPEGKLGKTENDGHIFLSPKLFEKGMEEIMKDVLFHEIMHLKLRKENPRDQDNEAEILKLEKERLLNKGFKPEEADTRILERRAELWGTMKNLVVGFKDWMSHVFKSAQAYTDKEQPYDWTDKGIPGVNPSMKYPSDSTNFPVNPNTEQPSESFYPTKKDRIKGPTFTYPTALPADFIAAPAQSIYLCDFNYDSKDNTLEGELIWDEGDFRGDKPEDILRALENKLKSEFAELRNLEMCDIVTMDEEDRYAEFYIEKAFKEPAPDMKEKSKEKKSSLLKFSEQDAYRTIVHFNEKDYEVDVRIIQDKPVISFPEHHPELKQEEASAIYALALRDYMNIGVTEEIKKKMEKKGSTWNKADRGAFLYMEPSEKSFGDQKQYAQCSTCLLWTGKEHNTCIIHGKDIVVTGDMTCGLYVNGNPMKEMAEEETPSVRPEVSGLAKKQVRCENCLAFNAEESLCGMYKKLNEVYSAYYSLDEKVNQYGCCNAIVPKVQKEASIERRARFKDGWLAPDGSFYQLDNDSAEMHGEWIVKNKEMLKQKYDLEIPEGMTVREWAAAYGYAFDAGWVRVIFEGFMFRGADESKMDRINNFIQDHFSEAPKGVFVDNSGEPSVFVSIEEIMDQGFKTAYEKELRLKKVPSASQKILQVKNRRIEQNGDVFRLMREMENNQNLQGVREFLSAMEVKIWNQNINRQEILTDLGKAMASLKTRGELVS